MTNSRAGRVPDRVGITETVAGSNAMLLKGVCYERGEGVSSAKYFAVHPYPYRRFHSAKTRRFVGMTHTDLGPSLVAQR